jgi:hypothetical protein
MLTIGSRLGFYEILGPLGSGGMGEVDRARDTKLGRDVAVLSGILDGMAHFFEQFDDVLAFKLNRRSEPTTNLTVVVTRHLQPLQYEPAHTAQQIVMWYSVRHWTLWVLLIGLPFAALLTGYGTLLRNWHRGADWDRVDRASLNRAV